MAATVRGWYRLRLSSNRALAISLSCPFLASAIDQPGSSKTLQVILHRRVCGQLPPPGRLDKPRTGDIGIAAAAEAQPLELKNDKAMQNLP